MDESVHPVDVAPPQPAQLSEPQAGESGDLEQPRVLVGRGVRGKQGDLGRLEHLEVTGSLGRLALRPRRPD